MMRIGTGLGALLVVAAMAAVPATAQDRPLGEPQDSAGRMMQPGMMQPGMMQPGMMQPGMMQPGMMQMRQRMHGSGMMSMMGGMQGGGMMGMMGGGMMGMAGSPGMILRLEETLELTDQQVESLEALHEEAQGAMRQHMMQGMQTVRGARQQLSGQSPDLDAYDAALREASDHMVLAHMAMARAGVEARELLTPEQRDRLDLARSMMMEMQGDRMNGMMVPGMMRQNQPQDDSAGHGH